MADIFRFGASLTEDEVAAFEACATPKRWNQLVDAAKAARDGLYPDDWWQNMVLSGRIDRIFSRWGKASREEAR